MTIVNGRLISAAGVVHRGGALRITARLPKGSAVIVAGQATNLTVHGEARAVGTNTVSGDVQVSAAATVRHRTTSGDLRIGITSDVTAHSVSGDVTVAQLSGRAAINTVAGDIAVHAVETSQVRAESVSGDIDITANPGVDVDADTHTVSGRSRNRRR
ncbi:DUF4097 domain-containing protein (plasmid) [Pseudonocardia sp. DSM 110487]|uniref:DUF4097 family beta strand repeat-containing protein n=1 Tax=Pseudonocardia sp. DSM 110487 TaxID=2865833 RepID=UPI001C69A438|nr:DUF4097 family beta strand repeat-containing protein [Pseudonocardia sp. DSM 110487]QYN41114.1 DUF4097 domain-containing protein [Pseudonocardia sp. DSM 110487]